MSGGLRAEADGGMMGVMKPRGPILLQHVQTEPGLSVAAALFREYAASLPFSLCFQGFDEELKSLPGKYAQPRGTIILAHRVLADGLAGEAVGCVAQRPILDERTCEMKRMYVKPTCRGLGVGRLLADELIRFARGAGFARMLLDSEPDFAAAMGLYRSLGFQPTERYNDDPHPQTVFMELRL